MIEILAVLGFPLAGAALLAWAGHRPYAPVLNAAASLATLLAAAALAMRVIAAGPFSALDRM